MSETLEVSEVGGMSAVGVSPMPDLVCPEECQPVTTCDEVSGRLQDGRKSRREESPEKVEAHISAFAIKQCHDDMATQKTMATCREAKACARLQE